MKIFINQNVSFTFNMKLNDNEKFVLKCILENPTIPNSKIAEQLNITSQAVGKIRRKLKKEGCIKNQELILDYEKMGVDLHAIALIKILPKASRVFKHHELDRILQPPNVIRSYSIPQTDVTHIMIYAFRNIGEYDRYFRNLQDELGEYFEIKGTYVFSSSSIVKSSSRDLFLKLLNEAKKEKDP